RLRDIGNPKLNADESMEAVVLEQVPRRIRVGAGTALQQVPARGPRERPDLIRGGAPVAGGVLQLLESPVCVQGRGPGQGAGAAERGVTLERGPAAPCVGGEV